MSYLIKPAGYKALLNLSQTEMGIKKIKDFFQQNLSSELRLRRVTAPLFVLKGMGINDDLNGTERAVTFPIKDLDDAKAEIVHSLAKWKRLTLADYQIEKGYGIYTDMNAIRSDEELGNPTFFICRPMGLGTRHGSRRTECRFSERNRTSHLCSHGTYRISGL